MTFMMQKLREAIGLLAANLPLFSLIVLTVWLPGSILLVYLRFYVFPETTGGDEFRMLMQEFRVSNAIEFAFGPLYTGGLLHALSQIKQSLPASYGESMAHGARRSFQLLGTRIGAGLMIFAGLIALIIPGVILALRFALLDAVVVLEGVSGADARKLSARMTQGRRWSILGTLLLTGIGLTITAAFLAFILYLPLAENEDNFAIAVVYECITTVLVTLLDIVLFLFYWDAKTDQVDA
jgi:hypothetical protein